jgi:hypothetical protein
VGRFSHSAPCLRAIRPEVGILKGAWQSRYAALTGTILLRSLTIWRDGAVSAHPEDAYAEVR